MSDSTFTICDGLGKHKFSRLLPTGAPHEDFEHVLGHRDHALIAVLRLPKIDDLR
jgi:hypothetical protein